VKTRKGAAATDQIHGPKRPCIDTILSKGKGPRGRRQVDSVLKRKIMSLAFGPSIVTPKGGPKEEMNIR